jgi:hypothetical protein
MSITSIGLWLVGWGSFLVVGGAFAAPPDATMGLRFKTRQTTVRQRVVFGVQTTGLGFVAMGSLAIALSQQVEWWLILVTMLVALAALDVLVAWPLKRVWDERSEIASRVAANWRDRSNCCRAAPGGDWTPVRNVALVSVAPAQLGNLARDESRVMSLDLRWATGRLGQ